MTDPDRIACPARSGCEPRTGRLVVGYMLLAGCNFVLPFYLIYVQGLRAEQVGP